MSSEGTEVGSFLMVGAEVYEQRSGLWLPACATSGTYVNASAERSAAVATVDQVRLALLEIENARLKEEVRVQCTTIRTLWDELKELRARRGLERARGVL